MVKHRLTIQVRHTRTSPQHHLSKQRLGQFSPALLCCCAGWSVPGGLPAADRLHITAISAPVPVWQAGRAASVYCTWQCTSSPAAAAAVRRWDIVSHPGLRPHRLASICQSRLCVIPVLLQSAGLVGSPFWRVLCDGRGDGSV